NDVLIVGAGPAGSTAATLLASRGLRVQLLEARRFPRQKLCGGLLTEKTLLLLNRVFGETPRSLHEAGIIDEDAPTFAVYWRKRRLARSRSEPPFLLANRQALDAHLLAHARGAGAEVLEETPVREIVTDPPSVIDLGGHRHAGRILLGADGVNSLIRRTLTTEGLIHTPAWQENLASGLECSVPKDQAPQLAGELMIHLGVVDHVYGWVFPHKDAYLIGVGGLNRTNRGFQRVLADYLDLLGVPSGVASKVAGHPIPYGNHVPQPAAGSCLLLGDAAGLVDPILGEGIYYAARSAELAANSILRTDAGPAAAREYVRLLQREVHPEFEAGLRWRRLVFAGPEFLRATMSLLALWGARARVLDVVHGRRGLPQWGRQARAYDP